MVIEGVIPLTIYFANQMEFRNKRRNDLDEDDLEKNIDKVAIEGNLSPKQIEIIKVAQGNHIKKGKRASASTMQTRNFF